MSQTLRNQCGLNGNKQDFVRINKLSKSQDCEIAEFLNIVAHACVCPPMCQEAGHPSQVADLGLSRGRGRWCPTVDSLSGPGRLLPWLLESTRAACRHTCLRALEARGQGRREGGAQECLLFSSPSHLCLQRRGAEGRLGQWGASESRLRARMGMGGRGLSAGAPSPPPPGWDSGVFPAVLVR